MTYEHETLYRPPCTYDVKYTTEQRNLWLFYSIREYEITSGFNLEVGSHDIESDSNQVPVRLELSDIDTSVACYPIFIIFFSITNANEIWRSKN